MTTSPVMGITDELVSELEALASEATPGPWGYDGSYVCTVRNEGETVYVQSWDPVADALLSKNVHYIATANPATILALLAERAELKRDRERYQKLRTVTPYRFKKIQDSAITDGGDVFYFHSDKFDAGLDASSDGLAREDKQ